MAKVVVITVSDRAAAGIYEDKTGPAAKELLEENLSGWTVETDLVSDDPEELTDALSRYSDADWIITAGGTGLGPRDRAPETLEAWAERSIPGLAEAVRTDSRKETPMAMISRVYAGQRDRQAAIALPGSPRGCLAGLRTLLPVMDHSLSMMAGGGHK